MKTPILLSVAVIALSGCASPSPWKNPPLYHTQEKHRLVFENQLDQSITVEGVVWVETKGPCGICVATLDGVLYSLRGKTTDAMLNDSGNAVAVSGVVKKFSHWPSGGMIQEIPQPFYFYYIEVSEIRYLPRFSTPPHGYGLQ